MLRTLTLRDAVGRYRGSALGLLWSFLHPLMMLAIYTVAFSAILNATTFRLSSGRDVPFVLGIFAGMTVFNLFNEVFTRAPTVIVGMPNFVKRVVFPLEILPAMALGSAMLHGGISLSILLLGQVILGSGVHATWLIFPVVLIPLALLGLTAGWFLSSLGVYVRDVAMTVGVISQVLFFATPVIYSSAIVPPDSILRTILDFNPLVPIVVSARNTLLDGAQPDWAPLLVWTGILAVTASLAYVWFARTRKGFADVL